MKLERSSFLISWGFAAITSFFSRVKKEGHIVSVTNFSVTALKNGETGLHTCSG